MRPKRLSAKKKGTRRGQKQHMQGGNGVGGQEEWMMTDLTWKPSFIVFQRKGKLTEERQERKVTAVDDILILKLSLLSVSHHANRLKSIYTAF